MTKPPVQLSGAPGSPYTRKMLALLRYRRIPYEVLWTDVLGGPAHLPKPKVQLLPTFYFPGVDGELEAVVDSTPIARRLEAEHEGREAIPPSPVLGFLNALIEDYADEWLTKAMFHYRWAYEEDAAHAPPLLVHWAAPSLAKEEADKLADQLGRRQIDRLYVVGSNAVTAETIESSYLRLLGILDAMLQESEFLFGARPATADFALYGQLTQLVQVDPTPARLAAKTAPRIRAWIERVDDLSGAASDAVWCDAADAKHRLAPLLMEIGRVYAPFLLANAKAAAAGAKQMTAEIDGRPWEQPTFPYQAKCLAWLREDYAGLSAPAIAAVDAFLDGTGCEALFKD